jgi:hypothetical protein
VNQSFADIKEGALSSPLVGESSVRSCQSAMDKMVSGLLDRGIKLDPLS